MSTNDPQTAREWLAYGIERVKAGYPIKRWSPDTITVGGRCAQLQRETVEGCLNLKENSWEVALLAHEFRKARGGVDRWASDYEQAARKLGLVKTFAESRVGDIFYWPYTATVLIGKKRVPQAYGHTAMNAGVINGTLHVLENSDWAPARRQQQGARLPLGLKAHVYLTPIALLGPPTTVITPTSEMLHDETRIVVPAPKPLVLPKGWYPTRYPTADKALTGRYVSIQLNGQEPVVFEVPADRAKELT